MGGGIVYGQDLVRKDPSIKYLIKQKKLSLSIMKKSRALLQKYGGDCWKTIDSGVVSVEISC